MTHSLPPMFWTESRAQPPLPKEAWLEIVNRYVNNGIDPLPGFPSVIAAGREWPVAGWCIDYAWTKRQELLRHGYAPTELLLYVVKTESGQQHAVLVVNGTVLDSILQHLYPLSEMRYAVVQRQSVANPDNWEATCA